VTVKTELAAIRKLCARRSARHHYLIQHSVSPPCHNKQSTDQSINQVTFSVVFCIDWAPVAAGHVTLSFTRWPNAAARTAQHRNHRSTCISSLCQVKQVYLSLQKALHAVLLKVAFQSSHEGREAPEGLRLVSHDV